MSEISNNDDDINKIVANFQAQNLKREIELLDEKLQILDKESKNKINSGNLGLGTNSTHGKKGSDNNREIFINSTRFLKLF